MKIYVVEAPVGGGKAFIEDTAITAPNKESVEGIARRIKKVLGIGVKDRIHKINDKGIIKWRIFLKRPITAEEFHKLLEGK